MRSIPEEWSERIPQRISPKRMVMLFRTAFHERLLEHGFLCDGEDMPADKRPSALTLLHLCRYYRVLNGTILQIVDLFLNRLDGTDGTYKMNLSNGGFIQVQVYSLADQIPVYTPIFSWGLGTHQQSLVHFRYPNMPEGYCPSFLHTFCDDMAFAMDLEQELFFEQTLPWLDRHAMPESYADWRMDKVRKSEENPYRVASGALWSQMQTGRWGDAELCVEQCLHFHLKLHVKTHDNSRDTLDKIAQWQEIRQCIQQRDAAAIQRMLQENRAKNVSNLLEAAPRMRSQLIPRIKNDP